MNWVLVLWSATAAVCLVLAGIHGQIWRQLGKPERDASGHFAALCLCVGVLALVELAMMHAGSVQDYLQLLRLFYIAVLAGFGALVYFVRSYLKAGRLWLGWSAIVMRALFTLGGLVAPGTLHFQELQSLVPASFLGAQVVVPQGTLNPLRFLAAVSGLLLAAYFVDAIVTIWRQRGGRQAIVLAAALLFLLVSGQLIGMMVGVDGGKVPFSITISFIPIIVIMGARLSQDLVRSARPSGELLEAERRLMTSRQRLAMAAEAAGLGFWALDPATLRFHPTALPVRLFEIPPDPPPKLDELLAGIHPEDRERVRKALSDALASSEMVAVEYRLVSADGSPHWALSAGGGRYTGSGAAMRLIGVTIDITDRKRAEEAARLQREEIEHLSRTVTAGEMSGALAQELRQPLAAILEKATLAQGLLRQVPLPAADLRSTLEEVIAADDRASQVIGRLRMLLRRGGSAPERLSLSALVDDVLGFLRPDLIRRGVQVDAQLDPALPAVQADRVRIGQVVINLIMNACDAMAATPVAERRLSIRCGESGGAALLEVSDRGSGLPAPVERVFEPFFTTKTNSVGMGLAICKSIVESHGGRIRAVPNADRGATLRVQLPFAETSN